MVDARLIQGVHDYVVGSLPWHIKLVGFLAGFRGDKQEGIRTLEEVAARGDQNRVDAEVLLCAIYRRERLPRKAVPLLEASGAGFPGTTFSGSRRRRCTRIWGTAPVPWPWFRR